MRQLPPLTPEAAEHIQGFPGVVRLLCKEGGHPTLPRSVLSDMAMPRLPWRLYRGSPEATLGPSRHMGYLEAVHEAILRLFISGPSFGYPEAILDAI